MRASASLSLGGSGLRLGRDPCPSRLLARELLGQGSDPRLRLGQLSGGGRADRFERGGSLAPGLRQPGFGLRETFPERCERLLRRVLRRRLGERRASRLHLLFECSDLRALRLASGLGLRLLCLQRSLRLGQPVGEGSGLLVRRDGFRQQAGRLRGTHQLGVLGCRFRKLHTLVEMALEGFDLPAMLECRVRNYLLESGQFSPKAIGFCDGHRVLALKCFEGSDSAIPLVDRRGGLGLLGGECARIGLAERLDGFLELGLGLLGRRDPILQLLPLARMQIRQLPNAFVELRNLVLDRSDPRLPLFDLRNRCEDIGLFLIQLSRQTTRMPVIKQIDADQGHQKDPGDRAHQRGIGTGHRQSPKAVVGPGMRAGRLSRKGAPVSSARLLATAAQPRTTSAAAASDCCAISSSSLVGITSTRTALSGVLIQRSPRCSRS